MKLTNMPFYTYKEETIQQQNKTKPVEELILEYEEETNTQTSKAESIDELFLAYEEEATKQPIKIKPTNKSILESKKKTIPQLLRESSKTGNYEFVILQQRWEKSENTYNHVMQRINGDIFGHIELSKELSDSIEKGYKCYNLKKERLSKFFNGYEPKITMRERVIKCLGYDKNEKYECVLQLIFDNTNYGEYDILDEFIKLHKSYKNNLLKAKDQTEQELLNYLKNNYLNESFIHLYNEFCKIIEENKDKLIGGDAKANEFFEKLEEKNKEKKLHKYLEEKKREEILNMEYIEKKILEIANIQNSLNKIETNKKVSSFKFSKKAVDNQFTDKSQMQRILNEIKRSESLKKEKEEKFLELKEMLKPLNKTTMKILLNELELLSFLETKEINETLLKEIILLGNEIVAQNESEVSNLLETEETDEVEEISKEVKKETDEVKKESPKSKIVSQQKAEEQKKLEEKKLEKQPAKESEQRQETPNYYYQKRLQEQRNGKGKQKGRWQYEKQFGK